jgi:hypothetical protein
VVRCTLPEGNTQIFALRYKLHLPTEEELAAELQRERWQIEPRGRSVGVEPSACLQGVLDRASTYQPSRIAELLIDAWTPSRS